MNDSPDSRLSVGEKIGYGLGDGACNLFWKMFEFYLLYFYTDVFGISAAKVATLFLITRAVDAVSDPLVGYLSDRTRTRWGRFRPYLLWGPIPMAIAAIAMFSCPDLTDSGKLIYAYATYVLAMVCYTFINTPYGALMGVISPNSIQRTSVATYRFVFAFSGALAVHYFTLDLVAWFGGTNEADGFFWTIVLYSILSIILFWISFWSTRERVALPDWKPTSSSQLNKSTFRQDITDLLSNSAWLSLFGFGLPLMLGAFVRNSVALFYLKYFCERADLAPSFFICGTLSAMAGMLIAKPFAVRLGKRNTVLVCVLINALATFTFFFLRPGDLVPIFVLQIASSLTVGPVAVLLWSMYADSADYSHWKNNRRATGLIFSAAMFAQKVGASIGAGLAAFLLSYFLYQAPVDGDFQIQTPETKAGIQLMMSLIPAAFFLTAAVSMFFYPLNAKLMQEIENELSIRGETR
ncbi:Inner membrane symporter YicJ [Rubripirellula obstinata]|uniref:Inner membrane symporter YicJ n=1 Tax=Rubripirellula obstinata TaxID=406547 RepID=A0A5B1CF01_9BACT|nr:MFS transporter [Rubripirellula obstinata]KAA1257914.1 Inner membrane symporter YicJ [Rubripirellula obstinata]